MGLSGPVPKHPSARARRNATFAMTQLPAEGRQGSVPVFPLPKLPGALISFWEGEAADLRGKAEGEKDGRKRNRLEARVQRAEAKAVEAREYVRALARVERRIWRELWVTPMAVQWEKQGWLREVAQYARLKAQAELGDAGAVRPSIALGDRLGLTPHSLLRLRWEIGGEAEVSPVRIASVTALDDARKDFQ